jgi:hypothetical protein
MLTVQDILNLLNEAETSVAYRVILINQLRYLDNEAYLNYKRQGA